MGIYARALYVFLYCWFLLVLACKLQTAMSDEKNSFDSKAAILFSAFQSQQRENTRRRDEHEKSSFDNQSNFFGSQLTAASGIVSMAAEALGKKKHDSKWK